MFDDPFELRHARAEAERAALRERLPRLERALRWARWGPALSATLYAARSGRPNTGPPLVAPVWQDDPDARIAIKSPAPEGALWGDTLFVRALGSELRALGYTVRIDPLERGHSVEGEGASLVLRGRAVEGLKTAKISVMWLISHPEEVSDAELSDYDHAFVASGPEAKRRAGSTRISVLLQAHLGLGPALPADVRWRRFCVFVGNSRFVRRPSVEDALTAGLPLQVLGANWAGRVPSLALRAGAFEPCGIYAAAGCVLNDHWPDMRRRGFVSNRVFDVVDAGGIVVSDPIPGLAEVFGGAALTYRSPMELRRAALRAIEDDALRAAIRREGAERMKGHAMADRARAIADVLTDLGVHP